MSFFEAENIVTVVREADGCFTVDAGAIYSVPDDPRNSDRMAIAEWEAAGGVIKDAPPPPPAPAPLGFLAFMELFTPAEQAAIVGSADVKVKIFTLKASGAGEIRLDDPEVHAGIAYLVSAGVLSSERSAAVLAGRAPN